MMAFFPIRRRRESCNSTPLTLIVASDWAEWVLGCSCSTHTRYFCPCGQSEYSRKYDFHEKMKRKTEGNRRARPTPGKDGV